MSFPAKPFNITMPENGGVSFALIATSRAGKSTFLKHLVKKYFPKHITIMFSQNNHADIYKDMSKKIICSDTYHPDILKEAHSINHGMGNKFPFCFISDDYVDSKIKHDTEITRLLTIYRNANCSSIFSFQGRVLMSAVGRAQVNYAIIGKQQTPKDWKAILDEYLSMWLPLDMTEKEQIEFCKKATENHQFFVIDNINNECYLTKLTKAQIS